MTGQNLTRPVVIFDGDCGFCLRQIDRLKRMGARGRFDFIPRDTPDIEQRHPGVSYEELGRAMGLVEPDGAILMSADAVHGIVRRLPGWRWGAWIYHVPGVRFLSHKIYGWIARNRMRFGSCGGDSCALPGDRAGR